MKRKNLWLLILMAPMFIACGGGGVGGTTDTQSTSLSDTYSSSEDDDNDGQTTTGTTTYSAQSKSNYMLTAWNDLGMHCMDGNDFSVFSVLPPYNNLHAQIKDKNGDLITSGVTLTYEAVKGTDGKINTSSTDKTNFWDHSQKLFGVVLAKDTGLTGVKTPSLTPQKLTFNTTHQWWEAEGIPITPYNDDGSKNYYPLVMIVAKDTQGNILSEATTVLPVSDEMDCKRCHESNAPSNAARPNAGWVNNADPEKDYKFNILRIHDEEHPDAVTKNATALQAKGYNYDPKGLESTANGGTAILCASCHRTNALPHTGVNNIKAFTTAIHSKHAKVTNRIDLSQYPMSNLTDAQKYTIAYMWNEEKLAKDIYLELNLIYPTPQLENIATKSETMHQALVEDLVERYDLNITNLVDYKENYSEEELRAFASGEFGVQEIQDLYDTLYAEGKQSQQAALEVGCKVEVTDVEDLLDEIQIAEAVDAQDLIAVWNVLLSGSYNHYWAFDKGLKNKGVTDGCCSLGTDFCRPDYPQNENGGKGQGKQ